MLLVAGSTGGEDTTGGFTITTTARADSLSEEGLFCTSIISFNPMRHYDYSHLIGWETEAQKVLDLPES